MTISSTSRTAGPFTGNDVTTTFAFTFKVFAASDLQLVRTNTSTGVSTTLTITADYTVTLNSEQNSAPGGSITLTAPLASGYTLIITSDIAALQATDLTNQGGFYPQVITNALDKLTILVQQILNKVGRSLNFPIQDTNYNPTLPAKAQRVGRVLAFDETTGDPTPGPTIAEVGTVVGAVADIHTVATDIANVNTVATNIADIDTVVANMADINTVSGDITNVDTVAINIADVNTVAGDIANVNTVGGSITNVNSVATNMVDVNAVAADIANVNTVAGIASDVTTVATNKDEVVAVGSDLIGQPIVVDYGDLSPATNPAAPVGALGSVWANAANIAAVAGEMAAVVYVSQNLQSIIDALDGALITTNNLSDLTDPAQARANLGLADLGGL